MKLSCKIRAAGYARPKYSIQQEKISILHLYFNLYTLYTVCRGLASVLKGGVLGRKLDVTQAIFTLFQSTSLFAFCSSSLFFSLSSITLQYIKTAAKAKG